MIKFLSILTVVALCAGCGIKAQTYVMTRERADIQPVGNGGFIAGKGTVQEPERKTRKVYVLEFTKNIPEGEVKKIEQETSTQTTQQVEKPEITEPAATSTEVAQERKIVIPPIEDESVEEQAAPIAQQAQGPSEDVEYVVQKDDTLQKIAHKYYGSYGKWVKIYEANKDRIKNPNVLRSGTKIIIPAVK